MRRQVLGAFLTITMFAMLANMIKRDQFKSVEVSRLTQDPVRTEFIIHVFADFSFSFIHVLLMLVESWNGHELDKNLLIQLAGLGSWNG